MAFTLRRSTRIGFGTATTLALALGGAVLLSAPAQAAAPSYKNIVAESCLNETTRSATWNIGSWQAIADGATVATDNGRATLQYADESYETLALPLALSTTIDADGNVLLTVTGIPADATQMILMFIVDGNMIGSVSGPLAADCSPALVVEPPVDPVTPVDPVDPVDVVDPVDPGTPVAPVVPVAPVAPVAPIAEPTAPAAVAPATATAETAAVASSTVRGGTTQTSLASTGTNDVAPISIAALAALLGGAAALLISRRSRAEEAHSTSEGPSQKHQRQTGISVSCRQP